MLSNIENYFERKFERFPPSLRVVEARQHPATYVVILDDAGTLLTLLHRITLDLWSDDVTLEAMHYYWPILFTLLESEAINIVDVARFFMDDLKEQPDVPGIVLVDDMGRPSAILSRDVLLNVNALKFKQRSNNEEFSLLPSEEIEKYATEGIQGLERENWDISKGGDVLERNIWDDSRDGPAEANWDQEKGLKVKRYGHLQFPAQVVLNNACQLTITINCERMPDVPNQVELGLARRDWPLKVIASLWDVPQEDFRILGPSYGIIEVPRTGDSAPLTFKLLPNSTGEKIIDVLFEQVGKVLHNYITKASIQTEVVASTVGHSGEAKILYAPRLSNMADPPDVIIYIRQVKDLKYHVYARTAEDKPGDKLRLIDTITFPIPPVAYLKDIFNDLDKKTSSGLSPTEFDEEVKKIGNNLYDKLFHEDGFKAFYWNYLSTLPEEASVQINSQEPYIPWEILLPSRLHNGRWQSDKLYFCQRFALSRWLTGPECGSRLPLLKVVLVAPPSDLRWVEEEVEAIKEMPGLDVTVIQDKQKLEAFFSHGEADVVHFACHGAFQATNPGRSVMLMGNRFLRPDDVIAENRNFGLVQPLVFLNACDSGRQGIGLTNLDGWADAFMKAGVGFFIGSVWKTTDQLAYEFAKAFYERLQAGDSVGEAMRQARQAAFMRGDATYLSYTLYANPRVRARSM